MLADTNSFLGAFKACRGALLIVIIWATPMTELYAQSTCDHIQVLSKEEADVVVADDYKGSAMTPGPNQAWVVKEAGTHMTPLLCQAVRRVAFFDQDLEKNAGLAGRTDRRTADLLQMSAADSKGLASETRLRLPEELDDHTARIPQDQRKYRVAKGSAELARGVTMQAILHEAAHAADYLLQRETVDEDVGSEATWDAGARALAQQAIDRNLLKMGLRSEWQRIHHAFVKAGLAKPYHGKGLKSGMGAKALVNGGFMSEYGGDKLSDDIAEMTAWALMSEDFIERSSSTIDPTQEEADRKDLACEELQAEDGPSMPSRLAAVYTKLGLLQTLGFISGEAFENCVGNLRIRGEGAGFHSFKSGDLDRSYTGKVRRNIGREENDDPFLFELSADGTVTTSSGDVPVRIMLILDVTPTILVTGEAAQARARSHMTEEDVSYPRGIYFIGFRHGQHNRLQIHRKDNGKMIMDVGQGVALVSRASRELIEGSVFVQRYFNYAGGLLSSIAGDEPVKEPTSITFRYEPSGR